MDTQSIENDFRLCIGEQISLLNEGYSRYRVFTPFLFPDGDHLSIVLKNIRNQWVLSDEAHTLMRLTYEIDYRDLQRGSRQKIIENALTSFGVTNQEGELFIQVQENSYGNALFNLVQGLIKISDVTYLQRERIRSTFFEDFRHLLEENIPQERRQFNYHEPTLDPESNYDVDCRINGMSHPLFIFAIPNDNRCRDVTITLHQFERWGIHFQSVAIFEDQQEISRPVLARFSDVAGKQFSSLASNRDRIQRYFSETLSQ